MTILPMFPEHDSGSDDTPLPLLVAKKWDFPLAFHIVDDKYFYAIQDWVRGILGEEDIRKLWNYFKKQKTWEQMSSSTRRLTYRASDGKAYQREYATDGDLYLIAQDLRVTRARPVLNEIRQFLSKAGVFVDQVRLDPKVVLTSGAMTPDQAMDAAIEMYRAQGKDDLWIQARMEGKIKRNFFINALKEAVAQTLSPRHYATATDDIYTGLWGRTAARLKQELDLPKGASLRDHQPMLGIEYQRITEGVAAQKLGERQELTWNEARDIVKTVAAFIGLQAKKTSKFLRTDLATGRPLLRRGK
jgi:hypothetical protein